MSHTVHVCDDDVEDMNFDGAYGLFDFDGGEACPNCGAVMLVSEGAAEVECTNCGWIIVIGF